MNRRGQKLEAARRAMDYATCPMCRSQEKSFAQILGRQLMARCRNCGLQWSETVVLDRFDVFPEPEDSLGQEVS